MVKKLGKPRFLASARERVLPIGGPVVTAGAAVHEAVRVHQLRRNNSRDAARWPSDCQAGHECGVLAEVIDTDAGLKRLDGDGLERLKRAHRRRGAGKPLECAARTFEHGSGLPFSVIKTCSRPAGRFQAGVPILPAIDRRESDWAGSDTPMGIGPDRFDGAIFVFEAQLADGLERAERPLEFRVPGAAGDIVHSVAQQQADAVRPFAQHRSDVVRVVKAGHVIFCPPGREKLIAHLQAVQ